MNEPISIINIVSIIIASTASFCFAVMMIISAFRKNKSECSKLRKSQRNGTSEESMLGFDLFEEGEN